MSARALLIDAGLVVAVAALVLTLAGLGIAAVIASVVVLLAVVALVADAVARRRRRRRAPRRS